MSGNRADRWERRVRKTVEEAGGSVRKTADGHLAILDVRGRFLMKTRSAGKRVGDAGGASDRILEQVVRRIEKSKEEPVEHAHPRRHADPPSHAGPFAIAHAHEPKEEEG